MSTPTLKGTQIRALKALAAIPASASLTRRQISERAFKGNSINFAPILGPMVDAKLITEVEIKTDAGTEIGFKATAAGRKAAKSAPEAVSRSVNGQANHKPLPKIGETFTKTYKGKDYKVTRLEDGFRYAGKVYPSLTAAAKAVRGTDQEINGWLFFEFVKAKETEAAK
jgi:hypothetical protein